MLPVILSPPEPRGWGRGRQGGGRRRTPSSGARVGGDARLSIRGSFIVLCPFALGDRDNAIDAIGRALQLGSSRASQMNTDIRLRRLRSDPRFIALVERIRS
jgi:hypothetical protein